MKTKQIKIDFGDKQIITELDPVKVAYVVQQYLIQDKRKKNRDYIREYRKIKPYEI